MVFQYRWHLEIRLGVLQFSVRCVTHGEVIIRLTSCLAQLPVIPNTYSWTIAVPAGLVSGSYQLGLSQLNTADVVFSPYFNILVPSTTAGGVPQSLPSVGPGIVSTVTIEYVFWDHKCGCSKTSTAASPLNTGAAATTYTWYENQCSCTKSAVVPLPTVSIAGTNYSAPLNPPVPSNAATAPMTPAGTTAVKTAGATPYTGDAGKKENSFFGLMALVAAAVLF
jgi:hypothetical protein